MYNERPLIISHKKVFLSYIACNEQPRTFGMLAYKNISLTFNNIKRKHSSTYLYFQNYCNIIKINAIL